MIDMQRKPEAKESGTMLAGEVVHHDEPRYPWGLEIRLEGDELDKLGIASMPGIGETVKINAIARITAVRLEQLQEGKTERCLTMQIEQMEAGIDGGSIAERMYGKR